MKKINYSSEYGIDQNMTYYIGRYSTYVQIHETASTISVFCRVNHYVVCCAVLIYLKIVNCW